MHQTIEENVSVHSDIVARDSHRSVTLHEDERNVKKVSVQSETSSTRDESCDPFQYRSSTQFLSNFDILAILVKSTVGTGLFAMPYAFSRVGLLCGIVLLICMGFLITKCLRLLLRIHETTCMRLGKSSVMYDEIVEDTLKNFNAKTPKIVVELLTFFTNALLIFYYLAVSSICVDFIGEIMRDIMKFEETVNPARYTSVFFPLFMVLNLSEDLHNMVLKSMAGNILILNVVIVGVICSFDRDTSDNWTALNDDILMYPKFIGIVFYSLSSPGLVLAIEHSTSNPWSRTKLSTILDRGMILIVCLHLFVGIIGYLKWGSNVSENFIRDIQREANGYTLLALIMQALAIYLTYGFQCYVPISICLKRYAAPAVEYGTCSGTLYLWEQIVRFAVTLVSCVLPIFTPRLRLRIALLGLTCNFNLTFFLPLALRVLLMMKDIGGMARRNRKVLTGILCIALASVLAFSCFVIDLTLILKRLPFPKSI